jgi:hypothetical protein
MRASSGTQYPSGKPHLPSRRMARHGRIELRDPEFPIARIHVRVGHSDGQVCVPAKLLSEG